VNLSIYRQYWAYIRQEAQLPQRNSKSAAHVCLVLLTDRALNNADVVQLDKAYMYYVV